jgi:3-oxoacyl-(acyl-carrier-protein) synthase
MKNKMYINGMGSISAQDNEEIFDGSIIEYDRNIFPAIDPEYRKYIPAGSMRRMSKAVKMGISAAKMALDESRSSHPDAIITGTGQGCKQDTEKFLEEMIDRDEELLSPTSFIQSTHNTVGGQIALHLKCNSYNVTYTQNSGSLESAFIDAQLIFEEGQDPVTVLVGGVDEISPKITGFSYLDEQLKQSEIRNTRLYETRTSGTITSEGAHFFCAFKSKNG